MIQSLGWFLQLLALGLVGSALLVGLVQGAIRTELAMMAAGGILFIFGRWLQKREE